MNCPYCGVELKENESVCPVCQKVVKSDIVIETTPAIEMDGNSSAGPVIEMNHQGNADQNFNQNVNPDANANNNYYQTYQETEILNKKYGVTTLLVLSILEFFCCCGLFGLIGILLTLLKLKPAIEARRLDEAESSSKTIRLILIIGLVLGILIEVGYVALQLIVSEI